MHTSDSQPLAQRKKLHRRYIPVVFSFYMAGIMALLMCSTIVALNFGVGDGFGMRVWHAYMVAMPVAFCCVLLVRPFVMKLVGWTVDSTPV